MRNVKGFPALRGGSIAATSRSHASRTPTAAADDDLPTRAFQILTDPDDDVDKTTQFSFEGFEK